MQFQHPGETEQTIQAAKAIVEQANAATLHAAKLTKAVLNKFTKENAVGELRKAQDIANDLKAETAAVAKAS